MLKRSKSVLDFFKSKEDQGNMNRKKSFIKLFKKLETLTVKEEEEDFGSTYQVWKEPSPSKEEHSRNSSLSTLTTKYKVSHSSNNVKMRSTEVGPSDFEKIKLIGKGDVGKVFLVRNKNDDKLFAMKGIILLYYCAFKRRNDQKRQAKESVGGAGNPSNSILMRQQPTIHL